MRSLQETGFSSWFLIPMALILGAFFANQFFHIQARYVKLIVGLLFFLAVSSLPMYLSLCLFVAIFPFATFVSLGDTNFIFVSLLLVVWIVRIGLRQEPRPVRSPLAWAIPVFIGFHVLGFLNIDNAWDLRMNLQALIPPLVGVGIFVLLTNIFRTEKTLALLLKTLCFTSLLVDVSAVYGLFTGGESLLPTWYLYAAGISQVGGRLGGALGAHDILADFSAFAFFLQIVLGMRTRNWWAKLYYYGLAVLGVVLIAATFNRGGAIILGIGVVLFLWHARHQLRWYRVAAFAGVLALALATALLATHFSLHDLVIVQRLQNTQLEGIVPDTRVGIWSEAIDRIREHPWIGHGPFVDINPETGRLSHWPHNGYLWYFYTIGIFGLLVWVWMLLKLIGLSRLPWRGTDFGRESWARVALSLLHIQLLMFVAAQGRTDHQRASAYLYLMWILFAITVIAHRLVRAEASRPPVEPEDTSFGRWSVEARYPGQSPSETA